MYNSRDHDDDDDYDYDMVYVYVLAPISILIAVGVISYICIQSRKLKDELIRSGQYVNVMPALVTSSNWQQVQHPTAQNSQYPSHTIPGPAFIHTDQFPQNVYSPKGLPPPPPYTN